MKALASTKHAASQFRAMASSRTRGHSSRPWHPPCSDTAVMAWAARISAAVSYAPPGPREFCGHRPRGADDDDGNIAATLLCPPPGAAAARVAGALCAVPAPLHQLSHRPLLA